MHGQDKRLKFNMTRSQPNEERREAEKRTDKGRCEETKEELKKHQVLLDEWIKKTGDKGLKTESDPGLLAVLKRWGEKCVNPEYDRVRNLLKK